MARVSRKKFIQAQGATCDNWTWSWSFINREGRVIIFGAWDRYTEGGGLALILDEEWRIREGKVQAGYKQSREHIRLIEEEGYTLMTFPMQYSDERKDDGGVGPAKMKGFTPELQERQLKRIGGKWYASDGRPATVIPEEVDSSASYIEGATAVISVNSYERSREARQKCIEHHGYDCAVCGFNFELRYGSVGEEYIHVHHLVPIRTLKKEYQVDPIRHLIPICPNCHAMIHRAKPELTIEELRERLRKRH